MSVVAVIHADATVSRICTCRTDSYFHKITILFWPAVHIIHTIYMRLLSSGTYQNFFSKLPLFSLIFLFSVEKSVI